MTHNPNLPNDEYHQHPAMSMTKLNLFARDENLLEWAERCPVDEEKLKTFDFGDAMHAICLEPHRLADEFVTMPKFNLRTNDGKAARDMFVLDNADKKILTDDEHKKLRLMFESVMAHPAARRIIEAEGMAEHSFFWTDRESGVDCRCRPDKIVTNGEYTVDIKTTPELGKFKFAIEDFRYFVQAPFYLDGIAEHGFHSHEFRFLVIQKTIEIGRYPCMVVTLPQEVIEHGRKVYREDLMRYAEFRERGELRMAHELELHHWFINSIHDAAVQEIH